MKEYSNAFIGKIDILGYDNLEKRLDKLGKSPSEALIKQIFDFLDKQMSSNFDKYSEIIWIRYGDGYVISSIDDDPSHLEKIIIGCRMLIAMSLVKTIPLRVAITQKTIKIDKSDKGSTVSGPGWKCLRIIEESLEWMGGFLYLPNYDGRHHPIIMKLIETTSLVIPQNKALNEQRFQAPFKKGKELKSDRTWFLNWYKCFKPDRKKLEDDINNWWQQFVPDPAINDDKSVRKKQENTISFGRYCILLREAAYLIYFSEINKSIKIGNIDNPNV